MERSQKTDPEEFLEMADLNSPELELRLTECQHYYNWDRPHGSLNGQTPVERLHTKSEDAPTGDEVEASYDSRRGLLTISQTWLSGDTPKRNTQATSDYPDLVRVADLIGQLSDPQHMRSAQRYSTISWKPGPPKSLGLKPSTIFGTTI